jgi:hypothetical protein
MDMHTRIGAKLRKCTLELADEFAKMAPTLGERKFDQGRVDSLLIELESGRFHSLLWAKGLLNGVWYRLNGQHTSRMLLAYGKPLPALDVVIEEWRCDTVDDLAILFATYDAKKSSRSELDLIVQHLRCIPMLNDVSKSAAQLAVSGIVASYANEDENYTKGITSFSKCRIIHEEPEFILWSHRYLYHRILRYPGVYAAAFRMYGKDKIAAEMFWIKVLEQTEEPGNPTRVLAEFLKDLKNPSSVNYKKFSNDKRAHCVKALHAWNAWRRGDPTNLQYNEKAPIPVAV